jgi:hypothetical protein
MPALVPWPAIQAAFGRTVHLRNVGVLIGAYGVVNINLWWGGVMWVFGLVLVALGLRALRVRP